jgi:cytochrome c biogenesis protein CcdA
MGDLPLALAAGMLAAVNPCGFALLPAYLSLLIVGDDGPGAQTTAWRLAARRIAALRALLLTLAMTLGFVGVFSLFGLVLGPVADAIQPRLPWFSVGFGVVLLLLGGWLSTGRALPTPWLKLRSGPTVTRSVPSMMLFGAAYALASLGCTIGPFLAVVVSSLRAGATQQGLALFVAYAAGMGAVIGVVAFAVALARTSALVRLRRFAGRSARIGGLLMIVSGGYVAWYGWYEVRLLRGELPEDRVIGAGDSLQLRIAATLDTVGAPRIAAVLGVLVVAVIVAGLIRHRRA